VFENDFCFAQSLLEIPQGRRKERKEIQNNCGTPKNKLPKNCRVGYAALTHHYP